MNAIVFEHVPVAELPPAWRAKLANAPGASVTVRIEAEDQDNAKAYADDPLFGMWRDRVEMAEVDTYVRKQRTPRYRPDGSRNDDGQ